MTGAQGGSDIIVNGSGFLSPTFERDVCFSHSCYLLLRLIDVLVTPPAKVESETKGRLPSWQPDKLTILLDDFLGTRSREKVEVEGTSYETVLDQ